MSLGGKATQRSCRVLVPAHQSLGGSRILCAPPDSYEGALPKCTGCFTGEGWDHEGIRRIQNRLKDSDMNYTNYFTLFCISTAALLLLTPALESMVPSELEIAAASAAGVSCCHQGKPRGAVRSCLPSQIRVLGKGVSNCRFNLVDTPKGLTHHPNTSVPLQHGQEITLLAAPRGDRHVSFCP